MASMNQGGVPAQAQYSLWRNLGSVLRQLLSARQNWREAYLYRQLDER